MIVLVLILAIIFILLLVKWGIFATSSDQKVPSGPFPLPILGNLLHLGDLPHIKVSKHMYEHKYKIMGMRFGSLPVVFIKDPVLMHEAFVTKWKNFSSRPRLNSALTYTHANEGGSNLVFSNGKIWKRYRRLAGAAFTRTKVRIQQKHLEAEVVALNHQASQIAKQKSPIDFSFFTKRYSLNIIQRLLFGTPFPYDDSDETSSKLVRQTEEAIKRFGPKEYISDYIPMLLPLDKAKLTLPMKDVDGMLSFVQTQIEERKNNLDPDNTKDLLDAILIEAKQHAQDGLFSDMDVRLICFDLYVAGIDTSSTSIDWFLYFLAKQPEYQERLFAEISHVSDTKQYLKYADVGKTPLLHATIQEISRIRPVVPFSVPRKNDEDDTIGGYFIPKDTMILWNVYGYNHDPEIWTNPNQFYPERFLDTKNELHNFGGGPRSCVAKNLGEEEVYQACAMLCQRFTWKLASPQTDALDNGVASIVLRPNKHKLIFSAR